MQSWFDFICVRIFCFYFSNSISLWVNLLVVCRWKPSKSGDLLKPSTSLYLEGKWENHACNTVIMCLKQLPNHLKKTIWLFQQWKNETANGLFFLFSKYQSGANLRGLPLTTLSLKITLFAPFFVLCSSTYLHYVLSMYFVWYTLPLLIGRRLWTDPMLVPTSFVWVRSSFTSCATVVCI